MIAFLVRELNQHNTDACVCWLDSGSLQAGFFFCVCSFYKFFDRATKYFLQFEKTQICTNVILPLVVEQWYFGSLGFIF